MAYPVVVNSLTGLALGDLMIGVAAADNFNGTGQTPNISIPSGFTQDDTQTTNFKQVTICHKYADAGDVANPGGIGFSYNNGSSTGSTMSSAIVRITGMKAAAGFNASNIAHSSTTGSITPSTQCLLLLIGGVSGPGGGALITTSSYAIANSSPSWTELFDFGAFGAGSSNKASVFCAWANATDAGGIATGAGSASWSAAPTLGTLALIAIEPQPITVSIVGNGVSAMIQPTYVRRMVQTIISTTSALIAPTSSGEIINKWNNLVKSATSVFRNQNKS